MTVQVELTQYSAQIREIVIEKTIKITQKYVKSCVSPELLDKIVLGDAFEILDSIEPKSVDLIIIDPPYSRFHHSEMSASLGDFKILEVYFKELAQKCSRFLKPTGATFFFCDYRTYPCLFYGIYSWLKPANLIVWKKDFLGPGIRFRPFHELIVYCVMENTPSPKDRHITDIWEAARVNNRLHPFQKPEVLYEIMINNCTNEGDYILDPYCGSGTALYVAKKLNRHFTGVDISPEFVAIANERLSKVPKRLDTFQMEEVLCCSPESSEEVQQ